MTPALARHRGSGWEEYDLLNAKTHRWFQRSICFYSPRYIMKVDDDTYVRLHKLWAALLTHPPHNLYFGDVYENVAASDVDRKAHQVTPVAWPLLAP
jgi:hypothetical protein